MELIADGLLIGAALTAALYCWVLSRRLNALKRMDKGLGGAIAGLSARVEQTKASLADTKASTGEISRDLSSLTARAEIAAGRLEILLATLQERPPTRRGEAQSDVSASAEQQENPKPVRRQEQATSSRKQGNLRKEPPVTDLLLRSRKPKPTRTSDDPALKAQPPKVETDRGDRAAAAAESVPGEVDGLSALRRIAGARAGR